MSTYSNRDGMCEIKERLRSTGQNPCLVWSFVECDGPNSYERIAASDQAELGEFANRPKYIVGCDGARRNPLWEGY